MKRLLVLADTHGSKAVIDCVLIKAKQIDAVAHLGDYVRDARYIREKGYTVYSVKGNCDYGDDAEAETLLQLGGKRLFLTHGHAYGVKYGCDRLICRAMELEAHAALFGHTHIACNQYESGILLLNPGSAAEPRAKKPSFAILEISEGALRADLKLV
jgi:uncharacterized protein